MVVETTLLGAIAGFGGSVVNGVVNYFQVKQQNAHEQKMATISSDLKLKEHKEIAPDEEHARLLAHDSSIDGVRAWVRPVLTYAFVGVYFVQVALIMFGWMPELSLQQADVMTGFNMVTGAILAFWFGSRATEKMNRMFGRS